MKGPGCPGLVHSTPAPQLIAAIAAAGMTAKKSAAGMTSNGANTRSRRTLLALRRLELDRLAFLQRLVAVHLDLTVVREEVLAAILRRDESKTLRIVEPLDSAFAHFHFLISIVQGKTRAWKRVTKIKEGN